MKEGKNHLVRVAKQLALLCDAARKGFNLACFGGWLCARWARETFPWQLLAIFKVDACVSFLPQTCRRRIEDQCGKTGHVGSFQTMDYILFSTHIFIGPNICNIIFM